MVKLTNAEYCSENTILNFLNENNLISSYLQNSQ